MTIVVTQVTTYSIVCDCCGKNAHSDQGSEFSMYADANEARRDAEDNDVRNIGDRDYCYPCQVHMVAAVTAANPSSECTVMKESPV